MSALPTEPTEPVAAVALHAERTDDPATVRWVVAGGVPATLAPADVEAVVPAGTLASVVVAGGGVLTTLNAGRAWPAEAVRVRTAVAAAVAAARDAADDPPSSDASLLHEARRVVAEEVNPYAAGHGGTLRVLDVREGVVEVALGGACHGCPAAAFTVQGRLGRRLADTPGFRGVRTTGR